MDYIVIFIAGMAVGALIVFLVYRAHRRDIEKSFALLSRDALSRNSDEFLKLARESLSVQTQTGVGELETKKKLIDQTLEAVKGDLLKVERLVADFDTKREKSFTELSTQLKSAAEQTKQLTDTTGKLQAALANSRTRGQWGERMAKDVLNCIGFKENINYTCQQTLDSSDNRPDFTFFLPKDKKVNMDVKFPWDNYQKFTAAQTDPEKEAYLKQFLADTRLKVKEIKTRGYINPGEGTVDYALMFIPNEQVFCFLQDNDEGLFDEALKNKVILCSPLTLFAILAVINKAMESFFFSKATTDIQKLLDIFYKQWTEFTGCMDRMGEKIKAAHDEYDKLATTRKNRLEKPLQQIEELSRQQGILEEGSGTPVDLSGQDKME